MKWKKWVYFSQNTEEEKSLIIPMGWVDERKSSQCVLEGWWQHGEGVNVSVSLCEQLCQCHSMRDSLQGH